MILQTENHKIVTKNLLELRNYFSKVAECKINIQKFVEHLYTKNELSERESKKTITCTITSNRIKYLEMHLIKEVKDSENCKIFMKETEDN